MPESTLHRIFFGNPNEAIDADGGYLLTPPFTFDRTDIFFDTTIRTFDETI